MGVAGDERLAFTQHAVAAHAGQNPIYQIAVRRIDDKNAKEFAADVASLAMRVNSSSALSDSLGGLAELWCSRAGPDQGIGRAHLFAPQGPKILRESIGTDKCLRFGRIGRYFLCAKIRGRTEV